MPCAVSADAFGPPESYVLRQHDPGAPGPVQLRLGIQASGVS